MDFRDNFQLEILKGGATWNRHQKYYGNIKMGIKERGCQFFGQDSSGSGYNSLAGVVNFGLYKRLRIY